MKNKRELRPCCLSWSNKIKWNKEAFPKAPEAMNNVSHKVESDGLRFRFLSPKTPVGFFKHLGSRLKAKLINNLNFRF